MSDEIEREKGRLLVRNTYDNKWLDSCKETIYTRSRDNRAWILLEPKKLLMRNSSDSDFIENDCSFNPRFDAECQFKVVSSVSCPGEIPVDELGSGDGEGSRGDRFDILVGYPAGYDLHDAGESGFEKIRYEGAAKGTAIKRPGLNYAIESYDETGVTPSYGRGNYSNPNYLGSSTFAGGSQITETVYDIGQRAGYFEVLFASYDSKGISVDVYYLGNRIATTCGRVQNRSKIEFFLDPAVGEGESRVMIRVRSADDGVRWTYQVVGPKQSLDVVKLDNTDLAQYLGLYNFNYIGTPVYPAPCHATVFPIEGRTADGQWFYEYHHYIGPVANQLDSWWLTLDYTSWLNADKFEVFHGAERIASTMDPDTELGMLRFLWKPYKYKNPVPDIMVRVTSADRLLLDDMQSWYYTLFCTNTPGYRANPWPCATPEAGVSSMGHHSTEDVYDLDNGVDPGVVSVKVEGYGTFEYVVTIFDMDMAVIATRTGTKTTFTQFIVNSELDLGRRKKVTVRIDAPLGSSWTYFVSCPIPLLNIELDDKTIPVCNDEVQLVVNDTSIAKGTVGNFTVSANIPVPTDVTFDFVTVDGTALSTGSSAIGNVLGIREVDKSRASFVVQNFVGTAGSMIVDASWHRMMNDQYKQGGVSSLINIMQASSTYATLSPEAKLLVNAWKMKIPDLTNKTWMILGSGDPMVEWAEKSSEFIQAMRNIYNMNVIIVPYRTTPSNNNTWNIAFTNNNPDIITVADSTTWFMTSGLSVAAVYMSGNNAGFGLTLATYLRQGKVLHFAMRQFSGNETAQTAWANALLQGTLNALSEDKIRFVYSEENFKQTPQYYVTPALADIPGNPLLENIDVTGAIDASIRQASVYYTPDATTTAPDYVSRSGSATIPTGAVSVQIPVEVLNPAHNSEGRQFFLDISNQSTGVVLDPRGVATITKPSTGGTVSNFNWTITDFSALSYTQYVGSSLRTFGASVVFGIGYSQLQDSFGHVDIVQPGKVAFIEANSGLTSNPQVQNVHGVCATYPYDPARTYQYKWEAQEIYNSSNNGSSIAAFTGPTEYSNDDRVMVMMPDGHRVGGRSTWKLFCYIKDDLGNVYKSNEITVSLSCIYEGSGGGGGGGDGPSGVIF